MVKSNDIQPRANLKFTGEGLIYSGDSRAIVVPTSSFGILRKDLHLNIGKERVKGFLIRYGSDLGRKDARTILKKFKHESMESIIRKGPIYHQLQGHVIPTVTDIKVEQHDGKVSTYIEGIWKYSYEAEEHIHQFGISDKPVCYISVGYANGYLTEICSQQVLFKEITCVGKGDDTCRWVGRTIDYWTDEMHDELKYYHEEPIVKKLELTYEKLLEERNNLKNVSTIYNELTEGILKGKDLQSIMGIVYEYTKTPILIENKKLKPLASAGISTEGLEEINQEFKEWFQPKNILLSQTRTVKTKNHKRLVTPIFLQGKIIGYCSFKYNDVENRDSCFLQMVIERISSVCALYLLNKKTEAEAEERMKGRFLEQLLSERYSREEILRRSSFIGLDLFQSYYTVVVNFHVFNKTYKEELSFLEKVMHRTSTYFEKQGIKTLMGQQANNLVLLFLKNEIGNRRIQSICASYLDYISKYYPSVTFRAGISMINEHIEKVSDSYTEALTSMRMATKGNNLVAFQTLGILGPLINTDNKKEVERIALYTLQPLGEKLDDKNVQLVKTLYFYLLNGGNLELTASELALSLSGLRYRVTKIEDLLNQDLRNPEVRYKLLLSIQALISTGKLELENY